MKQLPNGITGFWKIGEKPSPSVDRSLVDSLVIWLKGEVVFRTVTLTEPSTDNNFYIISLFAEKEKYLVAINSSYPYYCGIKNLKDWTTVEFCNLPDAITSVLGTNLTELKTDFLNQPLKKEHLTLLSKAEKEQIEYWSTKKIGNVIFNKYD